MKTSSVKALAITLALALSTGAVLLKHPLPKGLAPGAYSDIVITQDDTRKAPAGEKSATPTDTPAPDSATMAAPASPDQGTKDSANKGNPPPQ